MPCIRSLRSPLQKRGHLMSLSISYPTTSHGRWAVSRQPLSLSTIAARLCTAHTLHGLRIRIIPISHFHYFPLHSRTAVRRSMSALSPPQPAQTTVLDHLLKVRHSAIAQLMQRARSGQRSIHSSHLRLICRHMALLIHARPLHQSLLTPSIGLLFRLFSIDDLQRFQLLQTLIQQTPQRHIEEVLLFVSTLRSCWYSFVPLCQVAAAVAAELSPSRWERGVARRSVEGAFDGGVRFVRELGDGEAGVPVKGDLQLQTMLVKHSSQQARLRVGEVSLPSAKRWWA